MRNHVFPAAAIGFVLFALFGGSRVGAQTTAGDGEVQKQVERFIQQLGDESYAIRQRAEADLRLIGAPAFDALAVAAEQGDDLETSLRAARLLETIPVEIISDPNDAPEAARIMRQYSTLSEEERQKAVLHLGTLPGEKAIEPLCRLVRYERSPTIAKWAATTLVERTIEPQSFDRIESIVRQTLGPSRRSSAQLVLSYLDLPGDPAATMQTWNAWIDREIKLNAREPGELHRSMIMALLRRQFDLLEQRNDRAGALAATQKMVQLQSSDAAELAKFIQWLVKHKFWQSLDDVMVRFEKTIERSAVLLYTMADARLAQGKPEAADELALAASKLHAGDADSHYATARELMDNGRFRWAEVEFREVWRIDRDGNGISAMLMLAEMLHDQQQEKKAAEAMAELLDALAKNPRFRETVVLVGRSWNARKHLFWACHYESIGDRAKQKEELEKAISIDSTELDAIIALYRLADQTEDEKKAVKKQIQSTAAQIQAQIDLIDQSDDDEEKAGKLVEAYNQYAWLIGNTEGDYDRALKYSIASNELKPESAALLDTLGRCYYAKGDLENAVATQTQAVAYEPHSGSIGRQLEFFKQEFARKKGDAPKTEAKPADEEKPAVEKKAENDVD